MSGTPIMLNTPNNEYYQRTVTDFRNVPPIEILVCSTLHQVFHPGTKGLIPQFLMVEQKLKWIFAKTLRNKMK
jgi:hypothetical protein